MTEQPPWWYSGSSNQPPPESPSSSDQPTGGTSSLGDLVSMASTVVEWATDRVMAPHADHRNPAEHPQCLICRASALLAPSATTPRGASKEPTHIIWIDIDDGPDDPDSAAA